ncbi:hypothetical protein PMI09_02472 [Rhizobium sp. CF122]|uniref:hypothetical protein n=1 Tax=Rhizobium sp. CF122 TaxID=1144312 RepID=UPI0002717DC0|nr:hypothetical protein [Rhizobium sp. CF122]EJL54381.1 hypothetical protein PMI09_02472 [Rhizobium sp. CF122]
MSDQLLGNLRTPDQIAERITASTGINLTGRTVWEKARRLGIAKKIGRSMLISIDDIPLLLKQETKEDRRERVYHAAATISTEKALALLIRKARKKK